MRAYQDMVFFDRRPPGGQCAQAENIAQEVFLRAYNISRIFATSPDGGRLAQTVTTN